VTGEAYALEWIMTGTLNGTAFRIPGVSVGERDPDGKVRDNHDYWDSKQYPM
jgi:hypothetical protein